jgi:starch phosphorylase
VIPNFSVSVAELLIPASDISEHLSTAGMEASGTSNMKNVANGGLIVGTLDGANIEIAEEIGIENMFVFGERAERITEVRQARATTPTELDPRLRAAIDAIRRGIFGPASEFSNILRSLEPANDYYLVGHDFPSYIETQAYVDEVWRDKRAWVRRSILSVARVGQFSSDRAIREYSTMIWGIQPCRRPGPASISIERLSTSASSSSGSGKPES